MADENFLERLIRAGARFKPGVAERQDKLAAEQAKAQAEANRIQNISGILQSPEGISNAQLSAQLFSAGAEGRNIPGLIETITAGRVDPRISALTTPQQPAPLGALTAIPMSA